MPIVFGKRPGSNPLPPKKEKPKAPPGPPDLKKRFAAAENPGAAGLARGDKPDREHESSGGRKVVSVHLNDDLENPKMDLAGAKRVVLDHVVATLDRLDPKYRVRMRMALKMLWRDAFFQEITEADFEKWGI